VTQEKYYYVTIKTTAGDIQVKLYNETPLHRDNFVSLCKTKYFDGVLFHRVIDNFMIQSGDPDSKSKEPGKLYGDGGPSYTVPAEFQTPEIFHKRGSLAAAREGDRVNPERASSGSQFYLVKGRVYDDDEALNAQAARINQRNAAVGIESDYTLSAEQRKTYKSVGGTPHLDSQYTVFGEIVTGYEVVEKISTVETDTNDRPLIDVWIISTKVRAKRK
jgi:peptidyl-prolyl cis-trans isomerase B (cyclophilin B)